MPFLMFAIAGLWLADGLALLVAPDRAMALLRQAVLASPRLVKWGSVSATLGLMLLVGTKGLRYQPLWHLVGIAMIGKGLFFLWAPDMWRQGVVQWCLSRDPVDYRIWGLGLCALALLLLDALGWLTSAS
ncbi:MAG: hypothetical protein D6690_13270 [Nitrospirae bacterium]|nr:MAG: hypothetical protein D6690_13270 [Nitrospirota bacterium]